MPKLTLKNFDEKLNTVQSSQGDWIKVGMSTCGIAAGAAASFNVLKEAVKNNGCKVSVLKCGCVGMCYAEPLVEVKVEGMPHVVYGNVNEEVALRIIQKHILGKQLLNDYIYLLKEEDNVEL